MIKLSICIPTYNREKYLAETLDSILCQATEFIEVVVSDNASNDGTEQLINRYAPLFPHFKYYRWSQNMGADRNYLKTIEIASGQFCWFMGSDDIVEADAIPEVLNKIELNPDVAGFSVNRNAYSPDMSTRIWERPVSSGRLTSDALLIGEDVIFKFLGEYFGYLPGQIVNRSLWMDIVATRNLDSYMNAYVHIYVIGEMLKVNQKWLYLSFPCVGWRSGNDSFLADGRFRRLEIDVLGYEKVAEGLFGKHSPSYHSIMSEVASIHVWYAILGAKLLGLPRDFFCKSGSLCVKHYWRYPIFWIKTFPLFFLPGSLLRLLRLLYRATLKNIRHNNL